MFIIILIPDTATMTNTNTVAFLMILICTTTTEISNPTSYSITSVIVTLEEGIVVFVVMVIMVKSLLVMEGVYIFNKSPPSRSA